MLWWFRRRSLIKTGCTKLWKCVLFQEKIRANYDAIRFRPEQFIDYLLSDMVGFVTFEVLEIPQHKAAGKLLFAW